TCSSPFLTRRAVSSQAWNSQEIKKSPELLFQCARRSLRSPQGFYHGVPSFQKSFIHRTHASRGVSTNRASARSANGTQVGTRPGGAGPRSTSLHNVGPEVANVS